MIVTAVLAGLAALTGLAAIVMNWVMQRDHQRWQERQEDRRRLWEAEEEHERRMWQAAQAVSTRWDDYKRRLYAEFVSAADRLYEVSGELAHVRRDLAEDLVNHMAMVEEHYMETEGDRIKAMTQEADLHTSLARTAVAWFKERRETLSQADSDLRKSLAETVGELHLIAPDHIREQIDGLAGLSQQSYYGDSHARRQKREAIRDQFIKAVRTDLRVSAGLDGGP
jgi:hypothetical protein